MGGQGGIFPCLGKVFQIDDEGIDLLVLELGEDGHRRARNAADSRTVGQVKRQPRQKPQSREGKQRAAGCKPVDLPLARSQLRAATEGKWTYSCAPG